MTLSDVEIPAYRLRRAERRRLLRAWTLDARQVAALQQPLVRVLPHIVDTVLLASAIAMAVISAQYPFAAGWLTAKLIGLLIYIGCGTMALKRGRSQASGRFSSSPRYWRLPTSSPSLSAATRSARWRGSLETASKERPLLAQPQSAGETSISSSRRC
jgi:hypothetical protein